MAWFARARAWLGRMLLGRPVQQEFDEELGFHLDEATDTGVNCGLTYEQARRVAVRSLGSPPGLIKEECRDAWGLVVVSDLRRDTALAIRQLRRSPIFAGVALLTLTLAIGATVSIQSRRRMVDPPAPVSAAGSIDDRPCCHARTSQRSRSISAASRLRRLERALAIV